MCPNCLNQNDLEQTPEGSIFPGCHFGAILKTVET